MLDAHGHYPFQLFRDDLGMLASRDGRTLAGRNDRLENRML